MCALAVARREGCLSDLYSERATSMAFSFFGNHDVNGLMARGFALITRGFWRGVRVLRTRYIYFPNVYAVNVLQSLDQ